MDKEEFAKSASERIREMLKAFDEEEMRMTEKKIYGITEMLVATDDAQEITVLSKQLRGYTNKLIGLKKEMCG